MPLYVFSGWENCLQTQTCNQRLAWINYVMGTWDSLLQLWLEKCTASYKQPCRTKDASSSCHPQLKMSNPVTQQRGFHPEPQCTLPDMQSNINIKPPPCFVKPRVTVECFPPLKSVHWHSTELGRVPIFSPLKRLSAHLLLTRFDRRLRDDASHHCAPRRFRQLVWNVNRRISCSTCAKDKLGFLRYSFSVRPRTSKTDICIADKMSWWLYLSREVVKRLSEETRGPDAELKPTQTGDQSLHLRMVGLHRTWTGVTTEAQMTRMEWDISTQFDSRLCLRLW